MQEEGCRDSFFSRRAILPLTTMYLHLQVRRPLVPHQHRRLLLSRPPPRALPCRLRRLPPRHALVQRAGPAHAHRSRGAGKYCILRGHHCKCIYCKCTHFMQWCQLLWVPGSIRAMISSAMVLFHSSDGAGRRGEGRDPDARLLAVLVPRAGLPSDAPGTAQRRVAA